MSAEQMAERGKQLSAHAVRAYLAWVAVWAASDVQDGDTAAVVLIALGCIALAVAYAASLIALVVQELRA